MGVALTGTETVLVWVGFILVCGVDLLEGRIERVLVGWFDDEMKKNEGRRGMVLYSFAIFC